jgi:5-methylcytosine-specific restriction endonuclease McrA
MTGCAVAGCNRVHAGRGMCSAHFRRCLRTGATAGQMRPYAPKPKCAVVACGRESQSRGHCHSHYMRIHRHAEAGVSTIGEAAPPGLCATRGCESVARKRSGLCGRCYDRNWAARVRRERPDAFRLREAAWIAANPARKRESYRRRRARVRGVDSVPFDAKQLDAKYAYWGNACWICRSVGPLEADHVKPINKGGPHMLANLRPACARCNRAKRDRWPLPALARRG